MKDNWQCHNLIQLSRSVSSYFKYLLLRKVNGCRFNHLKTLILLYKMIYWSHYYKNGYNWIRFGIIKTCHKTRKITLNLIIKLVYCLLPFPLLTCTSMKLFTSSTVPSMIFLTNLFLTNKFFFANKY